MEMTISKYEGLVKEVKKKLPYFASREVLELELFVKRD